MTEKKKTRMNEILHLEVILLYTNSLSTCTVYAIHPIYEKNWKTKIAAKIYVKGNPRQSVNLMILVTYKIDIK